VRFQWPPKSARPPTSDEFEDIEVLPIRGRMLRVTVNSLIAPVIGLLLLLFAVMP
jgi:hypothetical protein